MKERRKTSRRRVPFALKNLWGEGNLEEREEGKRDGVTGKEEGKTEWMERRKEGRWRRGEKKDGEECWRE